MCWFKIIYDLGSFGGYQAIMYDNENGVYYGASESRKDGSAMGIKIITSLFF